MTEENWRDACDGRAARRRPTSRSRSRRATSGARSPRWRPTPSRERWNQQSVTSAQLAAEYGFTDVDGSRPDVWRYEQDVENGVRNAAPADYR